MQRYERGHLVNLRHLLEPMDAAESLGAFAGVEPLNETNIDERRPSAARRREDED